MRRWIHFPHLGRGRPGVAAYPAGDLHGYNITTSPARREFLSHGVALIPQHGGLSRLLNTSGKVVFWDGSIISDLSAYTFSHIDAGYHSTDVVGVTTAGGIAGATTVAGPGWKQVCAEWPAGAGSARASFYALKNDGTVWSWGCNDGYRLGLGDDVDRASPVQIAGFADIIDIATVADYYGRVTLSGVRASGALYVLNCQDPADTSTPPLGAAYGDVTAISAGTAFKTPLRRWPARAGFTFAASILTTDGRIFTASVPGGTDNVLEDTGAGSGWRDVSDAPADGRGIAINSAGVEYRTGTGTDQTLATVPTTSANPPFRKCVRGLYLT